MKDSSTVSEILPKLYKDLANQSMNTLNQFKRITHQTDADIKKTYTNIQRL